MFLEKKELPYSFPMFLQLKGNPESNLDKIVIFAYWLHYKKGVVILNSNDIRCCYKEARIKKLKAFATDLDRCVKKGHLIEIEEKKDNKKAFRITIEAERYRDELNIGK